MHIRKLAAEIGRAYRFANESVDQGIEYAKTIVNHGIETEGEGLLSVIRATTGAFALVSVWSMAAALQKVRQGKFRKACGWGVLAAVSCAGAALTIYNIWNRGYPEKERNLNQLSDRVPKEASSFGWGADSSMMLPEPIVTSPAIDPFECRKGVSRTFHEITFTSPSFMDGYQETFECFFWRNAFGPCNKQPVCERTRLVNFGDHT